MKVLITDDKLDSLLSIKISSDGGKTYTDYNVSSLKNDGLALDCNPNDLKVIYDTNILNYIKVLADGEKLNTGSGGGSRIAQKLNITANGDYHTPDGVYYDPIYVNVPLSAVGVTIVSVKSGALSTVGTPVTLSYNYGTGLDTNYVVWVGSEQINTRDLVVGQTYNYTISGSGLTFDITLKKESVSGGAQYNVTAEFKDRGSVYAPLQCFLVVGTLN